MLYEHLWTDAWCVIDKIICRSKHRHLYSMLYNILLFNPVALFLGSLSNALINDNLLVNRFIVALIGMHSERVRDFSACERERHVWERNGDCESCSVAG